MKSSIADLQDFAALDPFFRIIEQGLQGLVNPGHFFDLMAEDVVTEYVITVPDTRHASRAGKHSPSSTAHMGTRSARPLLRPGRVPRPRQGRCRTRVRVRRPHRRRTPSLAKKFISVDHPARPADCAWRAYLNPVAVFSTLGVARKLTTAGEIVKIS